MDDWATRVKLMVVDWWMAVVPRRRPESAAVKRCKIVSHRGEHDNRTVRENTMPAFERVRNGGVWGLETDIRWTADLVPVVIHDSDTRRVFGKPVRIADVRFEELRRSVPEVPSLAELIKAFGGNTHLMLELKEEPFPDIRRQKRILQDHLSRLAPCDDYHLLSLHPELFETFDIEPRSCCLTVAMQNIRPISEQTLVAGYGGLTGHFLLLNDRMAAKHVEAGQKVGTGFVRSRNCLYREINRGIEWIFSNDAVALQKIINELAGNTGTSGG